MKVNDVILFQGDSITDCGRAKDKPDSLGNGYVMMTTSWLAALKPELDLRFYNRGIGGNRTKDLVERWNTDCISLNPSLVSIMVGINDTWRRYDRNDATTPEQFESNYRVLLDKIKTELTADIVLLEPFILHFSEERKKYREDLDPKIEIVNKLAEEYKTKLIPLDKIFQNKCKHQPPLYWTRDGIHPTLAGHALIAQSWLKYVVKK